jgi:tetratricopeptide (TPR) repeat protein
MVVTAQQQDTTRARVQFEEGRAAMQARKFDDAAASFEHAVELNPTRSEYHLWLGHAYTKQLVSANFIRKRNHRPAHRAAIRQGRRARLVERRGRRSARRSSISRRPAWWAAEWTRQKVEAARLTRLNALRGRIRASKNRREGKAA